MNNQAIVIGSGIGGLAAAVRLKCKGYEVIVLEANALPGGKLAERALCGYRFDAGPSLFTLPHLVDELFFLAGKNPAEYFQYQKLEDICHYFYEDGLRLTAKADTASFAKEIEDKTGVTSQTVLSYLVKSRKMYELTSSLFLESSLHRISSYLTKDAFRALLHLPELDTFTTLHAANQHTFKDARITQLFDRYATYNGSDPYQAPGTLAIIPHLEYNLGAYFPKGGMYAIVKSLHKLATELGVVFRFNEKVQSIATQAGQLKGVSTSIGQYEAEIVVSNADIHSTYRQLLPQLKAPEKLLQQEKSTSAIVFYWGMNMVSEQTGLHNIFFSGNYQKEFETLFQHQKACDDPTVYLNVSSKFQETDAPAGCENWFVMVNVPADSGQDWDVIIQQQKSIVLRKLERLLQKELTSHIVCEQVLDPRKIASQTGSFHGALYGNSSNSQYAAFLRHANFSSSVKGLYFCGGSVHPGGGIPLCLLSAKIATSLIR